MGLALKGIIQGISNLSGMCYQLYNMSVAYICNFFLEIVYSVCVLCLSFYFIFLHQHKSKFLSFFIMLFKLFCLFFTFFYLSTSQDYFNSNHYPWNTKSNQKTNNSVTHIDPIKNEYFLPSKSRKNTILSVWVLIPPSNPGIVSVSPGTGKLKRRPQENKKIW